jgi:pimeloyl-ACP methyl ester carboxylesterase
MGVRCPAPILRPCLPLALAAVLLLAGCAATLPSAPLSERPPDCSANGRDCLQRGRALFEASRRAAVHLIEEKSGGYRLPSAPVAYLHHGRTRYSALLLHGLNDSAYYMEDLAQLLYRNGFNVITVLLPGHGTVTEDMLEATAEQWRARVEEGLVMASLVGEKVVVGGFSLGGALAIDAVLRGADVHAVLLFSPALRLRSFDAVAGLACAPLARQAMVETDLPPNPVKYKHRVGNGVCQLARLMRHNLAIAEGDGALSGQDALRALARRMHVPTFAALTYADERISPQAVLTLAGAVPAPTLVVTFGTPERDEPKVLPNGARVLHIADAELPHSFLVRRTNPHNGQANPYFDRMAEALIGFLRGHLE